MRFRNKFVVMLKYYATQLQTISFITNCRIVPICRGLPKKRNSRNPRNPRNPVTVTAVKTENSRLNTVFRVARPIAYILFINGFLGRVDFKAADGASKCRRCRRARVSVVSRDTLMKWSRRFFDTVLREAFASDVTWLCPLESKI